MNTTNDFYSSALEHHPMEPSVDVRYKVLGQERELITADDLKGFEHLFTWVQNINGALINEVKKKTLPDKVSIIVFKSDRTYEIRENIDRKQLYPNINVNI